MNDAVDDSIVLVLPASNEAPRVARREVDRWLLSRTVEETARNDVLLVVSELVTNAFEHTGSAPVLEVSYRDSDVRVTVRDRDEGHHPRLTAGGGVGGGFGLHIVARTARRWGWEPTVDGKSVWADVAFTSA